jgi:hypothetical protein
MTLVVGGIRNRGCVQWVLVGARVAEIATLSRRRRLGLQSRGQFSNAKFAIEIVAPEHRLVQQVRQADQGLGVRNAFAVDPAEGAIDQAPAHLPLTLIEAPVVQMLEDQHPKHDIGGSPQSATALTLGMALGQRLGDAIDQALVIKQRVDASERGIPELIGVGQEHFHETALPVRSPHHGASGEAARPQGLPRVSCAVARPVPTRGSLTIAHRASVRQRITVHSDLIPIGQSARTAGVLGPIRTGK